MTAYPRGQASKSGQFLNGHTDGLNVTDDCLPRHSHGLSMHSLTHAHTLAQKATVEWTWGDDRKRGATRWQKKNSITNLFGIIWPWTKPVACNLTLWCRQSNTFSGPWWRPRIKWNTHWPLSHKDTNHDKSKMISDLIQKRTGNL